MFRPLCSLISLLLLSSTVSAQVDSVENLFTHLSGRIGQRLPRPITNYHSPTRLEFNAPINLEIETIVVEQTNFIDLPAGSLPLQKVGYGLDGDSIVRAVYIKFSPVVALNLRIDSLLGQPNITSSSNVGEGADTGVWTWKNFRIMKYFDGPYNLDEVVLPRILMVLIKPR